MTKAKSAHMVPRTDGRHQGALVRAEHPRFTDQLALAI
jgi:hypothetical protein